MKLKAERTYQALFLSDVHYLVDGRIVKHSHADLFAMLDDLGTRRIRFREIFLVGDILESWYFSSSLRLRTDRAAFDRLFGRFDRLLARGGRKVFVIGNHDTTSFSMALAPEIERYLRKRRWQVTDRYETDDLVVVHGHQGQYTKWGWITAIVVVRLLHKLAGVWHGLFRIAERFYDRHLNHEDPRSHQRRLDFYRALSRRVDQGDRILVSGHTHRFLCLEKERIVNTGDWIDSRSFIVRHEKKKSSRFVGLCMLGPGDYATVFELRLPRSGPSGV